MMRLMIAGAILAALAASPLFAADPWVVYEGGDGPGTGKHVVLISGDEEYRSEEALPQLGRILARHHGFTCTVLFAIDKASGEIVPTVTDNIPGTEALATADLLIIATRFRQLPDDQMKPIEDYLRAGKPVIGMRTATHGFRYKKNDSPYAKYDFKSKVEGYTEGFGRQVLGETWINHHGQHAKESTRGVIAKGQESHPIVRGCEDIWGPTDVYTVRLPLPGDSRPLIMGQVLVGMSPTDKPLTGDPKKKNAPMMPVAWTKSYTWGDGKKGLCFNTTMGSSTDLASEGMRRLLVNAAYWAVGLEDKIPAKATVDIVGEFNPLPFGFGKFKKGVKPSDLKM